MRNAEAERGCSLNTTITDIARKLNVSVATVSRALNDRPGVSSELRQRIVAAANELGFVPNMTARSLATARTQTVGFVVPAFDPPFASDPFYFPILVAIEAELTTNDYHIMLNTSSDLSASRVKMVEQNRVDGLILAGPALNPQLVTALCAGGFPTVLIDSKPGHIKANTILTDDVGGAYEATAHLIGHGHTNIAHIGGPLNWISSRQRYAGYFSALQEAGLTEHATHTEATTVATGEAATAQLLNSANRPTAIFAANDAMAVGAIRAAIVMGFSLPDDLAVIGFDNIALAEHVTPSLTTVSIFKEQIGRLAARRILDLIDDPNSVPVDTVVSTELIIRRSCGCP